MKYEKNDKGTAPLETERLLLIPYTLDNAEELFEYAKDPKVGPPAGWKPHESIEESRQIIKEIFEPVGSWAIRWKEDNRLIGTIGLEVDRFRPDGNSREIGYSLASDMWGRGIMPEAVKAVLDYAFNEMKLDQVGICTGPTNKRSQGVIEKCGFVYEGTIRRAYKIYDGSFRESLIFSMTKEEYQALKYHVK